tara:strand:- start:1279 stop:1815 length:537 start_codon:yes stop_codon:yes gene_type:complete
MANRSKKVVLSARVEPYLKAALELYAVSRNEKIVKVLERLIENGLADTLIPNPLARDARKGSFMTVFRALWSEDEVIFHLRTGLLGAQFAGERMFAITETVIGNPYFKGDFDLIGDMNGMAGQYDFELPYAPAIDLALVKREWTLVCDYVDFLDNNKPFAPTYDDYKRMRYASDEVPL